MNNFQDIYYFFKLLINIYLLLKYIRISLRKFYFITLVKNTTLPEPSSRFILHTVNT
jgi:hypothetical protein